MAMAMAATDAAMVFFFYGTLVAGNANPVARGVHARLVPLGAGTVQGRLLAIEDPDGWYPALVAGKGVVHGQLYAAGAGFADDDLAALDGFENCVPGRPEVSDYERRVMAVRDAAGTARQAQVYCWLGSREGAVIADGDFAAWLKARGLRAYRAAG